MHRRSILQAVIALASRADGWTITPGIPEFTTQIYRDRGAPLS